MAQSMLSIKQRLNTVASIRKITNAMKLIAASRLVRLQGNLRGAKHYQAGMDACLQACLASVDFAKNPATPSCMRINESERDLYIVVTSNLGLCGAYNAEIFRLLEGRLTNRDDAIFIGEHGLRHFETWATPSPSPSTTASATSLTTSISRRGPARSTSPILSR